MKPKRGYGIIALAFLALTASRLTVSAAAYSIDLFNSTEYVVELVDGRTGRSLHTLLPGRSVAFAYANGVNIRLQDGQRLRYERVDPPHDFVRVSLLSAMFRAQLTRDLRIWVVSPNGSRPALPPPAQPPGFPLTPR